MHVLSDANGLPHAALAHFGDVVKGITTKVETTELRGMPGHYTNVGVTFRG
jgi:hypothetical protein